MNFNWLHLFNSSYYLDSNPGGDFLPGYILLVFFIAIIFTGKIMHKFAGENKYLKKSMKNKMGKFIFLGGLGIILVSARFSGVPVFSMRIWLYLALISTIGGIIYTYFKVNADYKKRLNSVEREQKKRMQ